MAAMPHKSLEQEIKRIVEETIQGPVERLVEEILSYEGRGREFRRQRARTFGSRTTQSWVGYNGKIADISQPDVLKHFLTLADGTGTGAIAGETRRVIAVIVQAIKMAGVGTFYVYPNEGAMGINIHFDRAEGVTVIAYGTQRLQYAQANAGDDWDIYCLGYVVEA